MKAKTLKAIQCPECGEYIPELEIPHPTKAFQCGECEAIYGDEDDAKECCKD